MNKNSKGLPKIDIVVYRVDFEEDGKAREAFNLMRMTDTSFNYPFGYRKLHFHGPIKKENGYYVYATVHMNIDQYVRKCAYSDSDQLRSVCLEYLRVNAPEKVAYFGSVCREAFIIKQDALQRKAEKLAMEKN